jgi:hypothetical protein
LFATLFVSYQFKIEETGENGFGDIVMLDTKMPKTVHDVNEIAHYIGGLINNDEKVNVVILNMQKL